MVLFDKSEKGLINLRVVHKSRLTLREVGDLEMCGNSLKKINIEKNVYE